MNRRRDVRRLLKMAAAALAAGTLLSSSCSSDGLEAAIVGLDAAADHLDHEDDDISFGDWILDELDH